MKYVLFLLMCAKPIISISVDNCVHRHSSDGVPIHQCEMFDFKLVNKGDSESLKLCFQPSDHFKYVQVSSYYDSGEFHKSISYLDKTSLKHGSNEVILIIRKKNDWDNQYNSFVNGKLKSLGQLDNWELESNKIFLQVLGSWNGSKTFISINETHSTNCPQNGERAASEPFTEPTIPSTSKPFNNIPFTQCTDWVDKSSSTTTICLIDSSYLQSLDKELNINICYTQETTFEGISISHVKPSNEGAIASSISSIKKFTKRNWYGTELIIKPDTLNINYEITFNNQTTSQPRAAVLKDKGSLAIIFHGGWIGSRNFSFGNNHIFSNCQDEGPQISALTTAIRTTTTTTILPTQSITSFGIYDATSEETNGANYNDKNESQEFVFYAAGSVLLIFVIIGLIVTFLICRKIRNAKKATVGSDMRHDRLPEVTDSTSDVANTHQKLDDSVYYANIPSHGPVQEGSRREQFHEAEDVTYLELDFGAANKKQKKTNKFRSKGPKGANKLESGQPIDNEENAYACIIPEVIMEKEEVAYANVGDHLSRNRGYRNFDGEVFYANVNGR